MFKLQLVLVGLLFGIARFNAVHAWKQLEVKYKLNYATLNITLNGTENNNILNDFKSEKYIENDSSQKNTRIPDKANSEEGDYTEGDLLYLEILASKLDPKYLSSVYNQKINTTDAENKSNPNDQNPEEGEQIEGDLLYSEIAASELDPKYFDSFYNQKHNTSDAENKSSPNDEYPEEGEHIEGDLLMPTGTAVRNALLETNSYWPGGLVPYQLNGSFTRDQIRPLLYAFDQYATKTCVRFYPRTNEEDYISIEIPKSGCASNVGRLGGKQIVSLAPNCFNPGTIMHELMHILGFLHEQNRYDRDSYIKILYQNIDKGHEKNYKKFSKNETNNLGVPYDYGSILHYRAQSFSKNDNPTIVPLRKIPKDVKMGQREGFSKYDLAKINLRYRCSDSELYQKVKRALN